MNKDILIQTLESIVLKHIAKDYAYETKPSETPDEYGDVYGNFTYVEFENINDIKDKFYGLIEEKAIDALEMLGSNVHIFRDSVIPAGIIKKVLNKIWPKIKDQMISGVRAANKEYARTSDRDSAAKAFINAAGVALNIQD